jgi:hypothetical protein
MSGGLDSMAGTEQQDLVDIQRSHAEVRFAML